MASGHWCFHVSNVGCVVCKSKITHLVSDSKSDKTSSRVVTQALSKIFELRSAIKYGEYVATINKPKQMYLQRRLG